MNACGRLVSVAPARADQQHAASDLALLAEPAISGTATMLAGPATESGDAAERCEVGPQWSPVPAQIL